VPEQFTWRGEEWVLQAVLRKWKTSGPCRHGSGEKYLRRHYYQVRVARAPGEYVPAVGSDRPAGPGGALVLTIYFERQPRRGQAATARWYVYTLDRVIGVDAG
jgi:phosphoribosylglycinamide formyltransferase-1